MSIDDNRKLTVDEYRQFIYKDKYDICSPRQLKHHFSLKNDDALKTSNKVQSQLEHTLKKMKSCKDIYDTRA